MSEILTCAIVVFFGLAFLCTVDESFLRMLIAWRGRLAAVLERWTR